MTWHTPETTNPVAKVAFRFFYRTGGEEEYETRPREGHRAWQLAEVETYFVSSRKSESHPYAHHTWTVRMQGGTAIGAVQPTA